MQKAVRYCCFGGEITGEGEGEGVNMLVAEAETGKRVEDRGGAMGVGSANDGGAEAWAEEVGAQTLEIATTALLGVGATGGAQGFGRVGGIGRVGVGAEAKGVGGWQEVGITKDEEEEMVGEGEAT